MVLQHLLTFTGNAFDRAMLGSIAARNRRKQAPPEAQSLDDRLKFIHGIETFYDAQDAQADGIFGVLSAPPEVREQPLTDWIKHIPRTNLRWDSQAKVLLERLKQSYESDTYNAQMHARWFGKIGSGRPVAILIHGYLGGDFEWEQRFWPIEMLYSWGLDVVMVALPFHGLRKDPRRSGPPKFPAVDPAWNIEGFRQAIIDLKGLVAFAQHRGHAKVGTIGMSLGGYTASLLATAERNLAFCVPMIPLASIPDFVRDHRRFPGKAQEAEILYTALERCMKVVAPASRPLQIDPAKVTIIKAIGDAITPPAHADRLAKHFGAELLSFHGGHLLQFGRAKSLSRVREKLALQGILPSK